MDEMRVISRDCRQARCTKGLHPTGRNCCAVRKRGRCAKVVLSSLDLRFARSCVGRGDDNVACAAGFVSRNARGCRRRS